MSVLSNSKILKEMKRGDIIIDPFDPRNLCTSSYDVTLGEYYYRAENSAHNTRLYNIYNERHMRRVWGKKPLRAKRAEEEFEKMGIDHEGIGPNDQVILLEPGEMILAHTIEFIGGRNHITTSMQARSSIGRSFITVCKCAGWGDVDFTNRWAMEITNGSRDYVIPLVVGRRIAQIIFMETGKISGPGYAKTGNYQSSSDMGVLKSTWSPEMMLPKLYKDRDIKKT